MFWIREKERGDQIHESHDRGENARCNHNAPEWKSKSFLRCGGLVEVSEDVETEGYHWEAKEDKSRWGREQGPGAEEVWFEERGFGRDEEDGDSGGYEVGHSIEEEELVQSIWMIFWEGEREEIQKG